MPAPRWLARFNLRVTNPLLAPLAKHLPGMGVIMHVGRKTQRRYCTPVLVFRRRDQVIIALTYGRESQWVQNVLAAKSCGLETQDHMLQLSEPHVIHDEEHTVVPRTIRWVLRLLRVSDFLECTVTRPA